ncbi:sigma-54 interaction domain-containing protein [Pollutimonas subterranea]|uniref:sigma-54 interaction domain-containing protein n=1 Tax=Pollutimonas subterranea TaxID=2045210 RepID=UPI003F71E1CC
MKTLEDEVLGAMVCDAESVVLYAFGVAGNDAVQQATLSACRTLENMPGHSSVMFHVDVVDDTDGDNAQPKKYIGLRLQDHAHQLVLLRDCRFEDALVDFIAAVPFAATILNHFITSPYQAVNVVDSTGKILYISPTHERFFGLRKGEGYGRQAGEVIPNSRLDIVATTGKAEIAQLQDVSDGVTRIVNRIPVMRDGEVVGAIGQVLFKNSEALTQMQRSLARMKTQLEQYRRELEELRGKNEPDKRLIGDSAPMQRLRREIETVAKLDVPVLILGESGTGKELVARAIHAGGDNSIGGRPLISLNLAALPATLLESELFGYAPGAFTGGRREGQVGKLEQAEGGTLFLDEVADIPMEMQVKLLRVLEDHMVERIGSHIPRRIAFRIVAATNRDIQSLIDAGRFRLDLYYRLSGVVLRIPALEQRREEIPAFLSHFVRGFCKRNAIVAPAIASDVARYLAQLPWPGNVRQLRQKVEEALVFCDGQVLRIEDFTREEREQALIGAAPNAISKSSGRGNKGTFGPQEGRLSSGHTLRLLEYEAVQDAISHHNGNKKQAAESLGISRSYLYKVLRRDTDSQH